MKDFLHTDTSELPAEKPSVKKIRGEVVENCLLVSKNVMTMLKNLFRGVSIVMVVAFLTSQCTPGDDRTLKISRSSHVVLIGNNLGR